MKGRNLHDQEREAVRELLRLVEQRASAEQACREQYEAAKLAANKEVAKSRKSIATDREREKQAITTAWEDARRTINEKYDGEQLAADRLRDFTIEESNDRAKAESDRTQTAYSDALWTADSLFEAAEKEADQRLDVLQRKALAGAEAIEAIWREAEPFLDRGGLSRVYLLNIPPAASSVDHPLERMGNAIEQARETVGMLRDQRTLRWSGVSGFLVWLIIFGALAAIPQFLTQQDRIWWLMGGIGATLLLSLLVHVLVRLRALRRCRETSERLAAALALASASHDDLLVLAKAEHEKEIRIATDSRTVRKNKAKEKYPPVLAKIVERTKQEIAAANAKHHRETQRLRQARQEATQKADSHFGPMLEQSQTRHENTLAEAETLFEERKTTSRQERDQHWNELARQWREGQDRLIDFMNHLMAIEKQYFLPWDAPYWKNFPPVVQYPKGMRFGCITIDLNDLPGGVPEEDDLLPTLPVRMDLPAFLPFPDRGSLVMRARDQGRDKAVQQLQKMMLRFLTAIPAGKVRFTVIDPVGLGDNFAAFMHLADYDENLIGARIWTEPGQIEKRLSDMTAHMENVIQKYLRNQYKSIEEYNAQAGEVAEPFRVLVVANFPANFSLEACKRLVSIVQSGATCGVYSLISIDTKSPVPQGFNVADLEQGSTVLVWKDGAFTWKDPDFSKYPLTLRPPPPADEIVRLTRIVGERGRDANRVEVPFDSVMPKPDAIWTGTTAKGIAVPIGRSGATKFQLFQLGKGTAQHALIAGKTGSGKSTLLHALITNLALHFSPEEIELYLIDFKKGVEFKTYAEHALPHARVVAIESEREFGLSVLQRLDAELRQRGDRFRDAGANDVAGYREFLASRASSASGPAASTNGDSSHGATPKHPASCPRIMLIVDEFQEFFVEDDKISQETALLLDRIVRQGRAFGIHVLLGSQTLGGAYSLARSTIDQMAVRIALQCSDADAQLILNKDNTAARLLSRPGEAIYNDANGMVEGNDLFQIVYLNEDRKEELLNEIHRFGEQRGPYPKPLVFEGNSSAELDQNPLLARLLEADGWPKDLRAVSAWLGEAIAIKDPTAAVFRAHSGNNLLIIGQQEEAALAMFSSAVLGLAAQHDLSARFTILDGTLEDDPNAGFLGRVAGAVPQEVEFADRTQVGEHLAKLGTLVSARLKGEQTDRSPRYLIIHGLQRYRELRKEDDFGFGRRGAEKVVSPAEHFGNILRDGPAVGVHTLVWCDALTNLGRSVDRQLMREFSLRVLFQMNANDSSTLIDNPIASKLGRNRALFITEEMPMPEKFRPYGLPSAEFLKRIKQELGNRRGEPVHA